MPLINQNSDLVGDLLTCLNDNSMELSDGDVLVIAHTIISKQEGRVVSGESVYVSERAKKIAFANGSDPIQVELALREALEVLFDKGVFITQSRDGSISNFTGVDKSNAPTGCYILLPLNPNGSAKRIQDSLFERTGKRVGIIISDTQGRPFRKASVNIAIGTAGINAFKHNKGKLDLYGRTLKRSTVCQADELAAAAEPLMGQADEGVPIVLIRGYQYSDGPEDASCINRPKHEDFFRPK
jgi:coenzyme F420-0:L-glutamate ligase/coenzyme F420-1:gamma-L-glutamate ligase